jgi:hypothetical protein
MGSYLHGTRGFANQIFINHRISCFIESNKREASNISDWDFKNLMLLMGNIRPSDIRKTHFKSIYFSSIPLLHQNLFSNFGFPINDDVQLEESNLITIRTTGKLSNNYFCSRLKSKKYF